MDISRYISDLLFENECVVLPGLGGFITNDKPATVNRITHQFTPPAKKIIFNIHLTANDGLLINHIAHAERLAYKEAKRIVDEFTEYCHRQLNTDARLTFDKIGVLYKNPEGHISFEQDEKINYNTEAFGLSSFYSPAIDRGTDEERLKKIVEPLLTGKKKPEDRKTRKQKNGTKKRYRVGAVALTLFLLLLIIGGGFTFTENARSYWNNYAALIPVFDTETIPVQKINNAPVKEKVFETPAEKTTVVTTEEPVAEKTTRSQPKPETIKTIKVPEDVSGNDHKMSDIKPVSGSYLIIAGSFSKEKNALKLIRQLQQKGLDAMIADTSKNGMYRVALASFVHLKEAKEKLYALRNEQYPDAWILRKK